VKLHPELQRNYAHLDSLKSKLQARTYRLLSKLRSWIDCVKTWPGQLSVGLRLTKVKKNKAL